MKTQVISRKNIHSFCRTCLAKIEKNSATKGQKYNISHNKELPKLISLLTSAVVNKKDSYPKFLCQLCFQKFENFKEFRSLCLQSKQTLDNILDVIKSSEPEKSTVNLAKNVVSYKEIETHENDVVEQQDKLEINERDIKNPEWLKSEEHDEINLIPSVNASKDEELNQFKQEIDTASISSFGEDNEDYKESFEYKDCTDDSTEETLIKAKAKKIKCDAADGTTTNDPEALSENETESSVDELINVKSRKIIKIPAKKIPKKHDKQHKAKQLPDFANTAEKRVMIQCTQCTRRCLSQENLEAHMRTHQGLKEFACKMCDRAYDKACRLKVHIDTKHRPQMDEFTCSFEGCEKKFTRTDSYRAHFRLKHTENQAPRMTYVCEDCGRIFQNVTQLREHRYKHFPKELYPYHCEQCGKRYTSQRTFKEHQLRHAGIKKFECKFCGMKKTTIKELNVHLNYHTKEKQWPCQLCTSVFNSSANLGLHVRIVHKGIRRFACGYCDQTFGKADTLKHHEMRHTGEKPHECQTCGKRFIQAVALRTHLKTHNKSDEKLAAKQQKLQQEIFLQQPQTSDVNEASTVCHV